MILPPIPVATKTERYDESPPENIQNPRIIKHPTSGGIELDVFFGYEVQWGLWGLFKRKTKTTNFVSISPGSRSRPCVERLFHKDYCCGIGFTINTSRAIPWDYIFL